MKNLYQQRDSKEWQQFLTLLNAAVMENKTDELLTMLLTADERNALGLRLQIVRALLENRLP